MKLYIVVRQDLSPGAQIAQSVHAFREFVAHHSEIEKKWYKESNTIVILAADNEAHLHKLMEDGKKLDLAFAPFEEPDFGDEVTAVVFEPKPLTSEFLSLLPLAGRFSDKT